MSRVDGGQSSPPVRHLTRPVLIHLFRDATRVLFGVLTVGSLTFVQGNLSSLCTRLEPHWTSSSDLVAEFVCEQKQRVAMVTRLLQAAGAAVEAGRRRGVQTHQPGHQGRRQVSEVNQAICVGFWSF